MIQRIDFKIMEEKDIRNEAQKESVKKKKFHHKDGDKGLNGKLSDLEKQLEDKTNELAKEKDDYIRLMAEFDNYKKRSAKERENIYTDVRVDTVTKFLPVYDNLERALKQETEDELILTISIPKAKA